MPELPAGAQGRTAPWGFSVLCLRPQGAKSFGGAALLRADHHCRLPLALLQDHICLDHTLLKTLQSKV